jgi:hypothetical protein
MNAANHRLSPRLEAAEARLRQDISRWLYHHWTRQGSDEAGLAEPAMDGRLDLLGSYVMGLEDDDADCEDAVQSAASSEPASPTDTVIHVPHVHCHDLTYDEFVQTYMFPNQPVVIQGLTETWPARKLWVKHDTNDGTLVPNLDYLQKVFSDDVVLVYEQPARGLTQRPTSREIPLAEYADWWKLHLQERTAGTLEGNPVDTPLLYLKDWKFVATHPEYHAYDWPVYFRNDWLNGCLGHAYKFCYLGPAGTSTVLHADVLQSFSWSTNVCGRKEWYLVPPEDTYLLYNIFGTQLATHLHQTDNDDSLLFPGLCLARQRALRIVQEAGETLFVPSQWYHSVENLADTLSINHNWLNEANLQGSLRKLQAEVLGLEAASLERTTSLSSAASSSSSTMDDNAQISDDIVLCYQVVSYWLQQRNVLDGSHPWTRRECSALLPVLQWLAQVLVDSRVPGLAAVTSVEAIQELINTVEKATGSARID